MSEALVAKAYINGEWITGEGQVFERRSPGSGELLGTMPACTAEQVNEAIESANAARALWYKGYSLLERVELLEKVYEIAKRRGEEMARLETLEMGKTIREAREDVLDLGIANIKHAVGDAMRFTGTTLPNIQEKSNNKRIHVTHVPVGVVGIITPWNFPIDIPLENLPQALVVGNPVVWKPSELAPFSAQVLTECFEEAGFPPGVFNVIYGGGDVGAQLVGHSGIHAVSFTGSTAVGEKIAQSVGVKKVLLELGGNGPIIVMKDGNVDAAVDASILGCFYIAGQVCTAAERILVHRDVHDEFVEKLLAKTKALRVGDPLDETTDMGPLVNEAGVAKTQSHVDDALAKGAKLLYGGKSSGLYYEPTVLTDVTPDMLIAQEETFGPVAPILTFETREEAVAIANGTKYGLTAGVFTSSLADAWYMGDNLEHGTVHINESTNYWDLMAPFGGFKQSGMGRELSHYMLENFTQVKQITFDVSKVKA